MILREILLDTILSEIASILEAMDPALRRNIKAGNREFRKLRAYSPSNAAHSVRVAQLARDFAMALQSEARIHKTPSDDLHSVDAQKIGKFGHLHDLGKRDIPRSILHKPGRLEPDEIKTMSTHSNLAMPKLARMVGNDRKVAELMAKYHHAAYTVVDDQVASGQLTKVEGMIAKIVMIADIFDALTATDRTYRVPDTKPAALEKMSSIKALDPALFRKFSRWQRSAHADEYRDEYADKLAAYYKAKFGHRDRKD